MRASEVRTNATGSTAEAPRARPLRLAFVGLGNIGIDRLRHVVDRAEADVVALMDPHAAAREAALQVVPDALVCQELDEVLEVDRLDGVVISSPNHLHRSQAERCLRSGIAVFCQKPMGTGPHDARAILDAAERAALPLGIDLTYHHTRGARAMREAIQNGRLGDLLAIDLEFHNGFGPIQDWFYDIRRSGGGCLLDLGVHLVEMALWLTDARTPRILDARACAHQTTNASFDPALDAETFARLHLDLDGVDTNLSCSWEGHVGQDARFEVRLHGTRGAYRLFNADRSFYRIQTDRIEGRKVVESIVEGPRWRGEAIHAWITSLHDRVPFPMTRLHSAVDIIHAARTRAATSLERAALRDGLSRTESPLAPGQGPPRKITPRDLEEVRAR